MMDEVGSDTSQKGDGAVGGEKFVCDRGTSPKEKCSSKSKHWTLIGLTSLIGDPVMCICIFSGLNKLPLVEMGMDIFAETVGDVLKPVFFSKNMGPGKLYPGGSTCIFKGKEVPCLCRWTAKGGVDRSILKDIVKTLDDIGIFWKRGRME